MPRQPFHLVEPRPWPITSAIGAFLLTTGLTSWFHGHGFTCIILGATITILSIYQWWRDVSREGTFLGRHTSYVIKGLRYGILLFIVSEVCFFFAFFW